MKDHFHGPEKSAYRQDCITYLREQAGHILLDEDGKLRGRWCELAGASGYLTARELVGAGVISEDQFVGVDDNQSNVDKNKAEAPTAAWHWGDFFQVVPKLKGLSVVNLDSYREAGSSPGNHEIKYLMPTIRSSVVEFGAFVLFYNVDLDAPRKRKVKPSAALSMQTQEICRQLSGWHTGCELSADRLLEPGLAARVDDSSFVGALGPHYYIYRSRHHRMANLKLIFR